MRLVFCWMCGSGSGGVGGFLGVAGGCDCVLGGGAGSKRCSEVCWLCSGVLLVVVGCGEGIFLGVVLEMI